MSLFSRLFGARAAQPSSVRLEVTGSPATFSTFSGDPYANDVFRAGVDAIARVFAKSILQPTVEFSDGGKANADERLAHILQVEPNPLMSAYDLIYLLVTHLYLHNNCYAYLQREHGQIVAVWPLHVSSCEFVTARDGRTLCALTFRNGRTTLLPYADIVHVRRHFNADDVMGDPNDAIAPAVSLADAQNAGMEAAIRTAGTIRGIASYAGILAEPKIEEYRRIFEQNNLAARNTGGVIFTDQSVQYTPINDAVSPINAADVAETKRKVFDYLGISESIVNSSFDDDGFSAFDESVIEALALQFSLELTRKVYSPLQVARGRRIECSTARIRFIGVKNRVALIENVVPMGIVSIDEARLLMGLSPIEGGDRFIQSLNYIDVKDASAYQVNRALINARKDGLGSRLTDTDTESEPGDE